MDFGEAIKALKDGQKVRRVGWSGKGVWIILIKGGSNIIPISGSAYALARGERPLSIGAHIDMHTVTGLMQPGWLASQADILAEDWDIV